MCFLKEFSKKNLKSTPLFKGAASRYQKQVKLELEHQTISCKYINAIL